MPLAPILSTPFDEVELDRLMSRGATFGPAYNTGIIAKGAGAEQRISQWGTPLYRGAISFEQRRPEMAQALQTFFDAREGQYRGFRYYDVLDHDTIDKTTGLNVPQPLAVIPGFPNLYQLQKVYSDGVRTQARKISKPISDTLGDTAANAGSSTVRVYQDGSPVGFTVDTTTGIVTIGTYSGLVMGEPTALHYYPLNETSGTTAHDSVGTANGTITGGVTLNQPGRGGGVAMYFNGGEIDFTSLLVPSGFTIWTLDGWFNASALGGTLLSLGGWEVYLDNANTLWVSTPAPDNILLSNLGQVTLGQWHYFSVCYDGTTNLSVIFDSNTTGSSGGAVGASGASTTFGHGSHGPFNGYLQDFAFNSGGVGCVGSHYSIPGLSATFEFHVPVRFASDLMSMEEGSGLSYHWSKVELQEIRIPTGLLINP